MDILRFLLTYLGHLFKIIYKDQVFEGNWSY